MNPERIKELSSSIYYGDTYKDESNALYRHVILPQELRKLVPRDRLLSEEEWRSLGVTQSKGWRHYMVHKPEPHILIFKKENSQQ